MLSDNMKYILNGSDPVEIIDMINEHCEYPSHCWIKDVIDHAPRVIVSNAKQGLLLAELKRREKLAREKMFASWGK